ncbi:N-methyltransferase tcpN [Paramyrothecium foliicola]|nr:N-methyltransferase tcpN [Paramyrothecium foliicola]
MAKLEKFPIVSVASTTESWTDTIYPFNRGTVEAELDRLNYNHFNCFLPLTGQLAPNNILDSLKQSPTPRIADVGTGNGIWLLSALEQLPIGAELYGFDLDPLKFPSTIARPNLTFQKQDVLSPFPTHLQGTFDLVHVRLLFFAMRVQDWEVAINNMTTLLKPGGWLLWEELGQMSVCAFPPSSGFDEWWRIHMLHGVEHGRDPMMPYRLPNKLKARGLTQCGNKIWSTWASEELTENGALPVLVAAVRPMLTAVVQNGGFETIQTMEDVLRVEDTLERDVQAGTRIGFDWHWAWGMRPLLE